MAATQQHRFLAIGTALGDDKLLIKNFSMSEQLGRLFQIEVELASSDPAVDFDKMVGSNATVRLELPDKKTRWFNGCVSRFVQTAQERNYARYRATLVPWLWFLTRTADCRIFQKKKVPDILEEVFKVYGFKDYKLSLTGTYREWEYCVQYRETDFNFVSRLMEQEGIYYFFKHEDGKHTLVLADSASAHEPAEGYASLIYRPPTHQGEQTTETVTDWVIEKEVQPGAYALADFDFKNPSTPILTNANISRKHEAAAFEVFDYPGEFEKRDEGDAYAKVRIQELQAQHEILRAQANVRGVSAGCKFTLKGHPREDQNRDYVITGASYQASVDEYETTAPGKAGTSYSCSFTALPASEVFRPLRLTPKPGIQGPQTAIVVGKKGEEIDTDEFGRVKVQFHWDRYGKVDENSSCWVRVSQPWAGKGWGALSIPRIGQEVIVEFLEGDPDRPIITGRVYNATARVPYALPGEKTKTTLKTNSSKGGQGFNEIRFEDKKGDEQIFIHAEKDQEIRIKNDLKEWVGNEAHQIIKKDQLELVEGDKHVTVKGNQLSKIEGDHGETTKGDHHAAIDGADHLTVKGDQCVKVSGDASFKTDKNLNQEAGMKISLKSGQDFHGKAGMNYAMDAGMAVHIKGGMTVVIEAGMQVSLKAGPSFVDIGPSGVSISGPMVMINSGGAAGSGGGSSPTAPTAPEPPDPPKEVKEAADAKPGEKDEPPAAPTPPKPKTYSAAAQVLKMAAEDGTPFCEECARAAEEEGEAEELAVIEKIAWLDGTDDKELSGDAAQWVNLPREAKWVDAANQVGSIDRLGRKPRFKVTFSKPGSHEFKVKMLPGDENLVYTDPEKGRNANFKWMEEQKSYTTGGDGTKIVEADFFTPCGGGDTFKLEAEDANNNPPVETGTLCTKRLVYYVVVKMKDLTGMAGDLSGFRSEFSRNGIELVEMPAVEIARIENIGEDESDAYENKCKTAFNGSQGKAKSPYAVAVGFTDHLAVKNPDVELELTGVEVGPGKPAVEIPVVAAGMRSGDGRASRSLWKDLVTGEKWFVSATFTPNGKSPVNIPEADCAAVPLNASNPSNCKKVKVDVSKLAAGTGTIKLTVNVVDRMRGGISLGGNFICACTRGWWKAKDAAGQIQTLIHEMGHKVGMVCTGTGKQPDKVVSHYSAKGHVGNHCHFGLPVQASYSNATNPQCIMFGSNATGRPSTFCENCSPAVRKMDLSAGWPT